MPSQLFRNFLLETDVPVQVPGQVRRVAIIGGGASGAVTLDSLVQENHFDAITLFERRHILGGIWVLDENPISTPNHLLKAGEKSSVIDPPLTNPFNTLAGESKIRSLRPTQERFIHTPAYHGMTSNIIEKFMTYSDEDQWKPSEKNDYVDRQDIRDYIERYIFRHKDNDKVTLSFKTTVEDVEKVEASKKSGLPYQFKVTTRTELEDGTDEWSQNIFDALVVAVGHYHVPFIPQVPGLREVQQKFPNVIHHAKFFTKADPYKDKTLIVVGSRALGFDLTRFSAEVAKKVYQLKRGSAKLQSKGDNIEQKPTIEKFVLDGNSFKVVFADGTEVENPDHVVYATGYQYLFPFLRREYGDITDGGTIVPGAFQHTFLVEEPLISIVGIPVDAISFRVFEFQAILVTRYLAGKVDLPSREKQKEWLQNRFSAKGSTRAYHTIGSEDALGYLDVLVALGKLKKGERITGREFPVFTQSQVDAYKDAALKLAEFWDEKQINK